MKQVPILSGKAMIVELPDGAKDFKFKALYASSGIKSILDFLVDGSKQHVELPVPDGCKPWHPHWRIIGMLSEVTESESSVLVKSLPNPWDHQKRSHRNYQIESKYAGGAYLFDSALESLESAIRAEGYTFQSTPKPENKDFYWGYLEDLAKWEAAQSRVLCRERCLLLRRVDG